MIRPTTYRWHQHGQVDTDESGCAIGVRKDFGTLIDSRAIIGSQSTTEGRQVTGHGIGTRMILQGKVVKDDGTLRFGVAAGHAPPSRAPKARATFMRALRRVQAAFKGGDMNLAQRMAERLLGRQVVGSGVLWLSLPRQGWKIISVRPVNVHGDHRAVLARIKHKDTGEIVTFLVINCMSVSTGPTHAANILGNGLAFEPDVIMASECSDFRARVVDLDYTAHKNKRNA